MQLISCHAGKLHVLSDAGSIGPGTDVSKVFYTGLPAWDDLPPGQAFARGAIHELLSDPQEPTPLFVALLLARSAAGGSKARIGESANRRIGDDIGSPVRRFAGSPVRSSVVWSDPRGQLYPPAVAALGIDLDRLYLLRPASEQDQVWAVAECLACRGVGATVAQLGKLSRVEARRLQLAAERGGGVGIFLRSFGKVSAEHAAVTRWLVRPAAGERTVQRWEVQLIHGHGGRVGQSILLEACRDTRNIRAKEHSVRAAEELAHPMRRPAIRASA